jgi:ubiquinone/menaquinone biosynthesis C-methylase UbiE
MPFEELKAKMAHVWGSAPWERAEHTLEVVHEHLVRVLAPRRGMRFLDIGTGAGAVARRAARAGADVVGVDPAAGLVESARRLAAEEGLDIRFDVGDAEALPYEDASFDAVASSMGLIFAPDHARAARELARVTRPGGRVAFSAWKQSFFEPVLGKYTAPPEPGQGDPLDWSDRGHVEELLGHAFELAYEEGTAPFLFESGEAGWDLLSTSVGPFHARVKSLDDDEREQLHSEFVDYLESFREGDEIVADARNRYVVVIGRRR